MEKNLCYKILDANMVDRKEKEDAFIPGTLYQLPHELTSTLYGFHYVKHLEDLGSLMGCGEEDDTIVYECEHGTEYENNGIFATDSIQLIREVPYEEIHTYAKENTRRLLKEGKVEFLIKAGCNHAGFAENKNPKIRGLVARCCNDEIRKNLLRDRNPYVREQIARRGIYADLMVLRRDKNRIVRMAVAKAGNGRVNTSMIHDPDWEVRAAVAEMADSKILSFMRKDEDWRVRMVVLERCEFADLKELTKDKNSYVRINANKRMEKLLQEKMAS